MSYWKSLFLFFLSIMQILCKCTDHDDGYSCLNTQGDNDCIWFSNKCYNGGTWSVFIVELFIVFMCVFILVICYYICKFAYKYCSPMFSRCRDNYLIKRQYNTIKDYEQGE